MIYWKVNSLNFNIASVRYRAVIPQKALNTIDVQSNVVDIIDDTKLRNMDHVIYVKSFSINNLISINETAFLTNNVYYDLCDYIFVETYASDGKHKADFIFREIAKKCKAIVTTGEKLGQVIKENLSIEIPIYVIPDIVEEDLGYTNNVMKMILPKKIAEQGKVYITLKKYLSISKASNKIQRYAIYLKNRITLEYLFKYIRRKYSWTYKKSKKIRGSLILIRNRTNVKYARKMLKKIRSSVRGFLIVAKNRCKPECLYKRAGSMKKRLRNYFGLCVLNKWRKEIGRKLITMSEGRSDNNSKKYHKILWFGNHGSDHTDFGMSDILLLADELDILVQRHKIELIVVSNNYTKYKQIIKPLNIKSTYYEWDKDKMPNHFSKCDVVIIPNKLDQFGICKSANRALLALHYGVPVVATSTPAMEKLSKCIILNNWINGIEKYLCDESAVNNDVKTAKNIIGEYYSLSMVANSWAQIINEHRITTEFIPNNKTVGFCLQLVTDFDLIFPFLQNSLAIHQELIVFDKLVKKSPEILEKIAEIGITYWILSEKFIKNHTQKIVKRYAALLSPTETNLKPHEFSRLLTTAMNEAGKPTYTMQHGHENIGLTYSDLNHSIESIDFSSDKIFLWGPEELLLPNVRQETKNKCVSVGLVRNKAELLTNENIMLPKQELYTQFVGVFENLHWHRYSKIYVEKFLEGIDFLVNKFDEVMFIIKPHPAGKWITERYMGDKPKGSNIYIIEADDSLNSLPLDILIRKFSAIITTPSTIAIDAAINNLPIAVLEFDLKLERYEYLFKVNETTDLVNFIKMVINDNDEKKLLSYRSEKFLKKYILSLDATSAISKIISKDIASANKEIDHEYNN